MSSSKPKSKFILLTTTLALLLLLLLTVSATATQQEPKTEAAGSKLDLDSEEDPTIDGTDTSEVDEIEELVAIDEEEEEQGSGGKDEIRGGSEQEKKEAEVLSRAQRIVLELNSDNVKRVVSGESNEYVMVLGYAPWCSRSAELMPHFAEAANKLKELGSPVLMAKIDADRYPKPASVLGIKGFPTLLLFVNGSSLAYTGGFTWEDIVIWVRKRTGSPVVKIGSVAEAEDFLKEHHAFVLGFFKNFEGPEHEEFVKAATANNEFQFVETSESAVAKFLYPEIKASAHFIGLVKSEPERYTMYDGIFGKDKILEFLEYNKFPLVTKLTDLNSVRVYSSSIKLQAMVFSEADEFKTLIEPLREIARKFKSKIMFIYIDIADENLAKPFLTLFGLEDSEDTVVAAFDSRNSSKYLLESDPTPRNIEEFCSGLLHGSMQTYFKSQPIPDNKAAGVKVVVGKTFDELVLKSPDNVLLEVYTPWCVNCETISKQVEKLAKHFKGTDSLVFAKIDASANEHPKLLVEDYPTLLFYPTGDKENPMKLSTKSSSKDLAAIIKRQLEAKEEGVKDEL